MAYKFKREPNSGLILVNIEIDYKYELKMILDTEQKNTTIDSNALYLLGQDLKDNIGTVEIETANGIIETEVYEIDVFRHWLDKEKVPNSSLRLFSPWYFFRLQRITWA
ncbi:MAG: hypothetical protein IPN26_10235 [Bacteroidetes bacterium]|nr:hypothetical protein [Bacteroidota bacterium]